MDALAKMSKYAAYKETGADWVSEIPESWGLAKIKNFADVFNGDSLNDKQKEKYESDEVHHYPYISSKDIDVNSAKINYQNGLRIPKEDKYKVCPPHSTLMCIEGGSAGRKIAYTNQHVCFVNKLACFVARRGIHSSFLYYYLTSKVFKDQFFNSMTGLIGGVAISSIKNFGLVLPSLEEQKFIAKFLNNKIAQIDDAIAIKKKQMSLLTERKKIIVQKAVTQGLDPSVPLMETELSWAPKIASHWSLLPNRLFMKIRRVPVGLAHESYQLLSLTKQGVLVRDLSKGAGKQSDFLERMQEVRKGDLIFCLFDVEETPRTVGLSDQLGMISADYTIFECLDEPVGRFLEYFYKNLDDQKLLKPLYKGLRNRIPKPRFLRTNCPMPPKEELIKILQYLDNLEVDTNNAISMILSQIEKLKEYKATLINSAVTGKIKVV